MALKYKKPIYILALVVILLSVIFSLLKSEILKSGLSDYALCQVNKKINGHLLLKNPRFNFSFNSLFFNASKLAVYDINKHLVVRADNLELEFKLASLLSSKKLIKQISASKIELNSVRDQFGSWNFLSLIKKTKRKTKFNFEAIDFPEIDLKIVDNLFDYEDRYADLSLELRKTSASQVFVKFANQNTNQNSFYLEGDFDLKKQKDFISFSKDLKLEIKDLDFANIVFFLNFIDFDEKEDLIAFLDRYGKSASLNIALDQLLEEQSDNLLSIKSVIKNFAKIPEVSLNVKTKLGKDIYLEKLMLKFFQTKLELKGKILSWLRQNPGFDLNLDLSKFDPFDLKSRFKEVDQAIPDFLYRIFYTVHSGRYVSGEQKITGTYKNPSFESSIAINDSLSVQQSPKKLLVNLEYTKDGFLVIKNLTLPIENSEFNMHGKYKLAKNSFNLDIDGTNIPLHKFKPIIIDSSTFLTVRDQLALMDISAYTSFDLNLQSQPKSNNVLINGNIGLGDVQLISKALSLQVDDFSTDWKVKNNKVTIENTKLSYLDSDLYISGDFDLSDISSASFSLTSPSINLNNLSKIQSLQEFLAKYNLRNLGGKLEDFKISFANQDAKKLTAFKSKAQDLSFIYLDKYWFSQINGAASYDQGLWLFSDLKLIFDQKSKLNINGALAQDFKTKNLQMQAADLPLAPFADILGSEEKFGFDFKDGQVNMALNIKDDFMQGAVEFADLDLFYAKSKYTRYPFQGLSGKLAIDKDLRFKNISGAFGNTHIADMDLAISNYKSEDRFFDLIMNGILQTEELAYMLPDTIEDLTDFRGKMPVRFTMKGNPKKLSFTLDAHADDLSQLSFADWFKHDPQVKISAVTEFVVTPQLIIAKPSLLTLTHGDEQAKLGFNYQVHDWHEKDQINYQIDFDTITANGTDLSLIEPHIISLESLHLTQGVGDFSCKTSGSYYQRQSFCDFDIYNAIAKNYFFGDLSSDKVRVNLLSVSNKPLYLKAKLFSGDWDGIGYKKVLFDLEADKENIFINNLKANLVQGFVKASTSFNFEDFSSKIDVKANNVSAHEFTDAIWEWGEEVPQGLVSGSFVGSSQGYDPITVMDNFVGSADVVIKEGKLSTLKYMQRILTAINTLKNFDFNNIFQILITYKGGLFDYLIGDFSFDKGKVSSRKTLLKAEEIELDFNGFVDFKNDYMEIAGEGLIPKRSKSLLQSVGIGEANLGNLLSIANLRSPTNKEKRFFDFSMSGPVYNMDQTVQSLRSNFAWRQ